MSYDDDIWLEMREQLQRNIRRCSIDFHEQEEREGRCPSCGRLPQEEPAWDICAEFHGSSKKDRD